MPAGLPTRAVSPARWVRVTDIVEMLSFHALGLPALAIDGWVMAGGCVLSADEIKPLLAQMSGGPP